MDEQTGKEQAELVGWILGEEWSVSWTGAGVLVQPNRPKSQIQPCMQHYLASRPAAAYVCELIDEAVMRREDVSRTTLEKLRIGDCHYTIKFLGKKPNLRPLGYEKRPLDARLATLRLLRQADGGG